MLVTTGLLQCSYVISFAASFETALEDCLQPE
jgi:hypothetical protein